ncbi:Origin recognition complex, subunit 1, partial [Asimina triloba]
FSDDDQKKKLSWSHGGEFAIGDDVYVKRREDASSDGEDPEGEECRICFKSGKGVMIECDDCLGGFHLRCLKPLMKEVPEGDWVCRYCEDQRLGKEVELPKLPEGIKQRRTAREKLLSSDLWAAYIESIWKETDGTYWFRGRWYIIPEETATDRQPRNLCRELYSINDFADIEYLLQTTMKKGQLFDHNSSIGALAAVEQDALRRKDERV